MFAKIKLVNSLFILLLVTYGGVSSVEANQESPPVITIITARPDAIYECGEDTIFTVTVKNENEELITNGTMEAILTLDGGKVIEDKIFSLSENNPFKISESLSKPGFLRLTCSIEIDDKKYTKRGASGYEPLKIKPATSEPEDFDKFWKNAIEQISSQPLDVKMEIIEKYSNDKQSTYNISFANINSTRIYGFLSVPTGKGPFPAIVTVPGAGPGRNHPGWVTGWGNAGVIGLLMNVHSYDPYVSVDMLKEKYKESNKPTVYYLQGAPDRDKYFFKNSIIGINRAIDYVAALPEFNKKQFVIYGSSQGGGHSLILTGLNKNITAAIANVPALCDHGGYLKDRVPGWPKILLSHKKDVAWVQMSGYFDAVNFARRITVPTVVGVGFIDSSCPPSSVYAAYNVIKAPKKIINDPAMGHAFSLRFRKFVKQWDKSQLGLATPISPFLDEKN